MKCSSSARLGIFIARARSSRKIPARTHLYSSDSPPLTQFSNDKVFKIAQCLSHISVKYHIHHSSNNPVVVFCLLSCFFSLKKPLKQRTTCIRKDSGPIKTNEVPRCNLFSPSFIKLLKTTFGKVKKYICTSIFLCQIAKTPHISRKMKNYILLPKLF